LLLHVDGEFASVTDLVKGTCTGRNFGWLPSEQAQAMAHIAHIIRDDDGSGELAQQHGGPYPVVLKGTDPSIPPEALAQGKIGNCIACHAPPNFTDFQSHNTGAAQEECDAIHGTGALAALVIPDLRPRRDNHDAYLPPTPQHPEVQGPFRDIPSPDQPGRTDLGLWNVYANPDFPKPQAPIQQLLCAGGKPCLPQALLPKAIALFKTPGLRDLGHSAPYLHTGRKGTLEDVLGFSNLARAGQLRNGVPALHGMALTKEDIAPLSAFLRAWNEDYG